MHKTQVTRHLPYRPEDLFRLVGDVEAYPKFVPWVSALRTWNRNEPEPGVKTLDAEAKVGFAFVREKFATRVRLDEARHRIDVSLLYGPFKRLKNGWSFHPDGEGTRIEFDIDFEFKSRMLDALLAANLRRAAERLIACFEGRAKALYGTAAPVA
jgi:coenzyme Q-binding protein COQ10